VEEETMFRNGAVVAAVIAVLISGYASALAQDWHNPRIKNPQLEQRQLVIDDGMCTAVADRSVPMPHVVYHPDGTHSFTGWGTVWNGSHVSTLTFNGFAHPSPFGSFASGFAFGHSIRAAIDARMDRDKIHRGCMYSLGWEEGPSQQAARQAGVHAQAAVTCNRFGCSDR
jgi:hypothetical protein